MNSKFTLIVRLLLGVMLIVFGSNKFLHFIDVSVPAGGASDFMKSLGTTGYIFPVVGALEFFIGLLLLFKKWIAFALILLAPISINIVLFHIFLDIPDIGIALVVAILNSILIYKHWRLYSPLFN